MKCPWCEEGKVLTAHVKHQFQYGRDGVTLVVRVPMRHCTKCNEQWLDHVSEDIITKVTNDYLDGSDESVEGS
jgi:YgiT-type zinc finger domain-containing protein